MGGGGGGTNLCKIQQVRRDMSETFLSARMMRDLRVKRLLCVVLGPSLPFKNIIAREKREFFLRALTRTNGQRVREERTRVKRR